MTADAFLGATFFVTALVLLGFLSCTVWSLFTGAFFRWLTAIPSLLASRRLEGLARLLYISIYVSHVDVWKWQLGQSLGQIREALQSSNRGVIDWAVRIAADPNIVFGHIERPLCVATKEQLLHSLPITSVHQLLLSLLFFSGLRLSMVCHPCFAALVPLTAATMWRMQCGAMQPVAFAYCVTAILTLIDALYQAYKESHCPSTAQVHPMPKDAGGITATRARTKHTRCTTAIMYDAKSIRKSVARRRSVRTEIEKPDEK
jgi:hypothetical protein